MEVVFIHPTTKHRQGCRRGTSWACATGWPEQMGSGLRCGMAPSPGLRKVENPGQDRHSYDGPPMNADERGYWGEPLR